MTKIKAVLDQETWVEVDVPDEFQAIVTSLFSSEALISENSDDGQGNKETSNESSCVNAKSSIAHSQIKHANSNAISTEKSESVSEAVEKNNKVNVVNSSAENNHSNTKERGKSTSQTLSYKDVGYHMVNWLVILFT